MLPGPRPCLPSRPHPLEMTSWLAKMGKEVIFYYDVVCPFAYMASRYVERLGQKTQATVHWRPVLLGE